MTPFRVIKVKEQKIINFSVLIILPYKFYLNTSVCLYVFFIRFFFIKNVIYDKYGLIILQGRKYPSNASASPPLLFASRRSAAATIVLHRNAHPHTSPASSVCMYWSLSTQRTWRRVSLPSAIGGRVDVLFLCIGVTSCRYWCRCRCRCLPSAAAASNKNFLRPADSLHVSVARVAAVQHIILARRILCVCGRQRVFTFFFSKKKKLYRSFTFLLLFLYRTQLMVC